MISLPWRACAGHLCRQGRGSDNLGRYAITGRAQAARVGTLTYNFIKTYTDRGANVPPDGHVNHVAFWAGTGSVVGGAEAAEGGIDELCGANAGFWGIWELVTGEPHFELQKGGSVVSSLRAPPAAPAALFPPRLF